ncbi:MAG TPA: TonB-dependent receptor [Gemmatimonadales bacterium]|jgi:vitamin B12 transporter
MLNCRTLNACRTDAARPAFVVMTALAALLLLAIRPVVVLAQVGDTARVPDLVVTATRVPTPAAEIPAAMTVIRGDDLRDRGVHFVLDALRDVPGVSVVQTGSYGAVTSLFLRGGESDYVKVLLDGVPLNLPGGSINFANLTTDDLDRIEIVRGPASVLYGADAMSGVIQLFTRSGSARSEAEITARGGSRGTSDLSGHADATGGRFSLSATGSRFASEGIYPFNSDYRNAAGTVHAGFDNGNAGHAGLSVRYDDGLAHFPTDGGGNVIDHNQFSTEQSFVAGLDGDRTLGAIVLHLEGYASRLNEGFTNREDSPADTVGFDFVEDRTGITWRRGAGARVDWHGASGTVVSVGAGLERETDDEHDIGTSNFGDGASVDTSIFSGNRTTRDGYLQLLSNPGRLSVQLGGRLDDNSAFGSFGTWRAGLAWHLTPGSRIWAGAGTAFKAPTFSELFAQSAFEVGNPDLAPERSRNGEVGAETALAGRRAHLGVTAFWQTFHDLIQFINAAPGDANYVNLGGASSRGIELIGSVDPGAGVSISGHWTFLHTEVTDTGSASSVSFQQGGSLIRRPGSSGGATLGYRWRGVTVEATALYVGARDDVDFSGVLPARVILPAYTTFDLALDVPVLRSVGRSPGIDLTVRGENVFNASYQQTVGFPGRGRTLLAGGRLRY